MSYSVQDKCFLGGCLTFPLNHLTFSQPTSCFWYWLQAAADPLLPELHCTDLISWFEALLMHWHGNLTESHLTFMHVQTGRAEELMPCGPPITNQGWAMLGICSCRKFWGIFYIHRKSNCNICIFTSCPGATLVICHETLWKFIQNSYIHNLQLLIWPVEARADEYVVLMSWDGQFWKFRWDWQNWSVPLFLFYTPQMLAVVSLDSFPKELLKYIRLCFLESTG